MGPGYFVTKQTIEAWDQDILLQNRQLKHGTRIFCYKIDN